MLQTAWLKKSFEIFYQQSREKLRERRRKKPADPAAGGGKMTCWKEFRINGNAFMLASPQIHSSQKGNRVKERKKREGAYTEWQRPLSGIHSIMMEKLTQAGEVRGVARPSPFTISTLTYKVVVYTLLLRGQITPPPPSHFYSTLICTLWEPLQWTLNPRYNMYLSGCPQICHWRITCYNYPHFCILQADQSFVYLGPACPALNSLGLRLRKSSSPPGEIMRGTSASQCQQYCGC